MRNTALFAVGLSVLLIMAFFWWFSPSWPWLLGYIGLGFVATLTVPVFYRLAGFTRADEIDWLERREEQEHFAMQAELVDVRKKLDQLDVSEGVAQVDVLRELLDDYHGVVETRFRGKSKSPLAYLSAARRAQQQVIHNLNDVVATRHSLSSISRHDGNVRQFEEERSKRLSGLEADQQQRMTTLLDDNQQLLDALTDTAVEVANIRTVSDYARLDTLARLVSLAEIASNTGK